MDFFRVIQKRHSVRAYKTKPVPERLLQKVLNAAVLAPTAVNSQPFQIIVIHTTGREEELRRIYNKDWFIQAPVVLGICGIAGQAWVRKSDGKSYLMADVAIVVDHLTLAAAALRLGTCWIAAFDPIAAREVLGIPEDAEPMLFTPLGYPAGKPGEKKRKPLGELVRYERW